MSWSLYLRTSDDVLSLTERRAGSTVALHKYNVVQDRRGRIDPERGATNDRRELSKLAVRHDRSVVMHRGRIVDYVVEPIPEAAYQLAQRDIEVRL